MRKVSESFGLIRYPICGTLIKRTSRFTCLVNINGDRLEAYLPNSGRLDELLIPGAPVILERKRQTGNRLHDLLLIQTEQYPSKRPIWVCVDSRLPKRLVRWCIERRLIEDFKGRLFIKEEVRVDGRRIDLFIKGKEGDTYVETKSVNLVDLSGIARFPDAPTKRGSNQLTLLAELKSKGAGAYVVFVIMREDAKAFSPLAERDPLFSERLLEAVRKGVKAIAMKFSCGINMEYMGMVDMILPPPPFNGPFPPRQMHF